MASLEDVRRAEPVRNIFHLHFPSQHLLTSTFMRFQEFYESPRFKGKVFTREEFEDWYAQERGEFTYYSDWSGFNVPSRVFTPFRAGKFDPLTRKEQWLLAQFRETNGRFYVIGTYGEKVPEHVFRHEIGHGLFYTRPVYKQRALQIIGEMDTSVLREYLGSKSGYHPDVFDDEVHAHALASLDKLLERKKLSRQEIDRLRPMERRLRALYEEFAPGL